MSGLWQLINQPKCSQPRPPQPPQPQQQTKSMYVRKPQPQPLVAQQPRPQSAGPRAAARPPSAPTQTQTHPRPMLPPPRPPTRAGPSIAVFKDLTADHLVHLGISTERDNVEHCNLTYWHVEISSAFVTVTVTYRQQLTHGTTLNVHNAVTTFVAPGLTDEQVVAALVSAMGAFVESLSTPLPAIMHVQLAELSVSVNVAESVCLLPSTMFSGDDRKRLAPLLKRALKGAGWSHCGTYYTFTVPAGAGSKGKPTDKSKDRPAAAGAGSNGTNENSRNGAGAGAGATLFKSLQDQANANWARAQANLAASTAAEKTSASAAAAAAAAASAATAATAAIAATAAATTAATTATVTATRTSTAPASAAAAAATAATTATPTTVNATTEAATTTTTEAAAAAAAAAATTTAPLDSSTQAATVAETEALVPASPAGGSAAAIGNMDLDSDGDSDGHGDGAGSGSTDTPQSVRQQGSPASRVGSPAGTPPARVQAEPGLAQLEPELVDKVADFLFESKRNKLESEVYMEALAIVAARIKVGDGTEAEQLARGHELIEQLYGVLLPKWMSSLDHVLGPLLGAFSAEATLSATKAREIVLRLLGGARDYLKKDRDLAKVADLIGNRELPVDDMRALFTVVFRGQGETDTAVRWLKALGQGETARSSSIKYSIKTQSGARLRDALTALVLQNALGYTYKAAPKRRRAAAKEAGPAGPAGAGAGAGADAADRRHSGPRK